MTPVHLLLQNVIAALFQAEELKYYEEKIAQ
jgi:hypothetical protein